MQQVSMKFDSHELITKVSPCLACGIVLRAWAQGHLCIGYVPGMWTSALRAQVQSHPCIGDYTACLLSSVNYISRCTTLRAV